MADCGGEWVVGDGGLVDWNGDWVDWDAELEKGSTTIRVPDRRGPVK